LLGSGPEGTYNFAHNGINDLSENSRYLE